MRHAFSGLLSVRYSIAMILPCALFIGCADSGNSGPTTKPLTMQQRQEAALKDPFSADKDDKVDITGGDITTLDKKAMKRDLNSLFNP